MLGKICESLASGVHIYLVEFATLGRKNLPETKAISRFFSKCLDRQANL